MAFFNLLLPVPTFKVLWRNAFTWIFIKSIVLILFPPNSLSTRTYKDIDTQDYFCGIHVPITVEKLCLINLDPTNNRRRRAIADECCLEPCSRRFIVYNYCFTANEEYINNFTEQYAGLEPEIVDTNNNGIENMNTREYFCGDELKTTLESLCLITTDHTNGGLGRILIKYECCTKACSRNHIVKTYCHTRNEDYIKNFTDNHTLEIANVNNMINFNDGERIDVKPDEGYSTPKISTYFVNVPIGILTGKKVITHENLAYYSFQKVPYAEPPVGRLRFQAPVPKRESFETFDNTKGDHICYQIGKNWLNLELNYTQTEDCLYLNIYTPALPVNGYNVSRPVLVFFHGGGFYQGFANENSLGPDFLMKENIVVVTVNYRLGPFGFLSTEDTVIPGNAGLKDQLLALKWVNENIDSFGGDPLRITIGGEDAGAASAVLFMLNKEARGLFRGVIAQSGSALSPWSYQRKPRHMTYQLAQNIDKNFTTSHFDRFSIEPNEILRDFLTVVSPEELVAAASPFINVTNPCSPDEIVSFAPVVEVEHDGAFLTAARRYDLMDSGNVTKVPILLGFTSEEFISFINKLDDFIPHLDDLDKHLEILTPVDMNARAGLNKTLLARRIQNIYSNENSSIDTGSEIRFCSDIIYTNGVLQTAELLSKWTEVYLYQLSYPGILTTMKPPVSTPGAEKVGHFTDHFYFWHVASGDFVNDYFSTAPRDEAVMHRRIVRFWTNFITNINMLSTDRETRIQWPKVGNGKLFFMNVNSSLEVQENPREGAYEALSWMYEEIGSSYFNIF